MSVMHFSVLMVCHGQAGHHNPVQDLDDDTASPGYLFS
jgi:hypothetical protein